MGIERRQPERAVLAGNAGEKERWDWKFPIKFLSLVFETWEMFI